MDKDKRKILKSYFDGSVSQGMDKQAKTYIIDHRNDDALNDVLAEEWNQTPADNQFQINREESWSEIKHHLKGEPKHRRMSFFSKTGMTVAATIALAILTFVWQNDFLDEEQLEYSEKEIGYTIKKTNKGEKLNVSLPDGSTIRLNSSTELRIPSNYATAKNRMVQLDGEAFFNISKFEGKPFQVVSNGVTTEVLGTSFNINTDEKTGNTSVAVVTGKVQVNTMRSRIVLHPNEITAVRPESINLKKSTFYYDEVIGWNDNLLVFNESGFQEVIDNLEEWYGVEFVITGNPSLNSTYNGRFENKSLQLVLEGLGFSSSFDYQIKNKTVFLKF